jgi:cob(I)alamin adenosyltransferase
MMSIATKRGDGGQTSLAGGVRISKGGLRVEAYGTIDELNSVMGFARSICEDAEVRDLVKPVQRELFAVGSAVATAPGGKKKPPAVTVEMVEALTTQVHRIEGMEGVLAESGEEVNPHVIAYLNRLSDLLWLCGRWLELRAGVNARLREEAHSGPQWSRAW